MENALSRFSFFFLRKKDINIKVSEFHIHQNNIETEWHAKEWISDQCPGVMVGRARVENRLCIRCLKKNPMQSIFISSPLLYFVCTTQVPTMAYFTLYLEFWNQVKFWEYSFQTWSFLRIGVDVTAGLREVRCPRAVQSQWSPIPTWLCSQVTYWRACKETKETQIRADMKSALPDWKQLSHRGSPANQEKKMLKKCQTKDEIIAGPRCGEAGHSCLAYAQRLRPWLVNLIIFLHKWLPENGSLNHRLGGETQSGCLFPRIQPKLWVFGQNNKDMLTHVWVLNR